MSNIFKDWGACVDNGVATISCLPIVFTNLLNALLAFVGTVTLIFFLIGCFKFTEAAGNPEKIKGVKNTFIYALIGFIIMLFSFTIIKIISAITGVDCIADFAHFGFFVCQ